MTLLHKGDDPVAVMDTPERFEEYLVRWETREALTSGLLRQFETSTLTLTGPVRELLAEAVTCLTRDELAEQIALNESDRLAWADYEHWCERLADAEGAPTAPGGTT